MTNRCGPHARRSLQAAPRPVRGVPLVATVALAALVNVTSAAGCAGLNGGSGRSGDTAKAEKLYSVGLGSFQNGMLEDAKVQLDKALKVDPKHGDSHYLMGVILLQEGKAMIDAIEGEICLTDDAAELQRQRADELHRRAHEAFTAATQSYEESEPGRGRAFNSMSVVSLYFHDFEAAEREAKSALGVQFYTERYSALANLGWSYFQQGNLVEAMTELRQSVMLNPDFCVGRLRLAKVYFDYGFIEPAAEEITKVVGDERCPIPEAHQIHASVALRLGQESNAAAALASCVALAPRSCIAEACRAASTNTVATAN